MNRNNVTIDKSIQEQEYEVKEIIGDREATILTDGKIKKYKEYYVNWVLNDERTWEPVQNLMNCKESVMEYELKRIIAETGKGISENKDNIKVYERHTKNGKSRNSKRKKNIKFDIFLDEGKKSAIPNSLKFDCKDLNYDKTNNSKFLRKRRRPKKTKAKESQDNNKFENSVVAGQKSVKPYYPKFRLKELNYVEIKDSNKKIKKKVEVQEKSEFKKINANKNDENNKKLQGEWANNNAEDKKLGNESVFKINRKGKVGKEPKKLENDNANDNIISLISTIIDEDKNLVQKEN